MADSLSSGCACRNRTCQNLTSKQARAKFNLYYKSKERPEDDSSRAGATSHQPKGKEQSYLGKVCITSQFHGLTVECPLPSSGWTDCPSLPNANIKEHAQYDSKSRAKPSSMEVTSLNFEVVFPKIIDAYTRCDLISIDCEFSGVRCFDTDGMPIRTALRDAVLTVPSNAGRGLVEEGRDTELGSRMKEEGYRRLKSAAHKYTILQLGMTFVWIDKGELGVSHPRQR